MGARFATSLPLSLAACVVAAACSDPIAADRPLDMTAPEVATLGVPNGPSRHIIGSPAAWEVVVLGTLGGATIRSYGINGANVVVGQGVTAGGNKVAWRWKDGVLAQLPLPFQYTSAIARAVNASGQIVGTAHLANGWPQAFVYADPGGAVGIQPWIQGDIFGTFPWDINAGGTIVGSMEGFWDAIKWTPAGGSWTWAVLPSIPGSVDTEEADAINDAGVIVGTSMIWKNLQNFMVGWVKHPGSAPYQFPSFGKHTIVGDVNASGTIVGWTGTSSALGTHFSRSPTGVMVNLYVPSDTMGSFGHAAVAISDNGRIAGTDAAVRRAFTLRGDTLTYLPLPPGAGRSIAGDVNACGVIAGSVGTLGNSQPDVAVIWRRVTTNPRRVLCDGSTGPGGITGG